MGPMSFSKPTRESRGVIDSLLTARFSLLLPLLFLAGAAAAQDMTGAPCLPIPGGPPCPPQQGFPIQPDPSTSGATTITPPTTVAPMTGVPTIRGGGPTPQLIRPGVPQMGPGQQQFIPGQQQFVPGQPQQVIPGQAPPAQASPLVILPQTPPAPLQSGVAPPAAVFTPPVTPQIPAVATQPGITPQPQVQVFVQPEAAQRSEFQDFVAQSVGRYLPIFGHNLFSGVPSTFAPVENVPVTPDYVIGPGDEILIRAWGQVDIDYRAVVDRNGMINIPRVGNVNVAGIRYQDLSGYLRTAIGRIFRNFQLTVALG